MGGQILNSSGTGVHYSTFVEVETLALGQYQFCFEKPTNNSLEVHFDVMDEMDPDEFVGREDINKLIKRISLSLMDVRKIGWEMKEVIQKHVAIKEEIKKNNSRGLWWTIIKCLLMGIILFGQFWTIKKVYK